MLPSVMKKVKAVMSISRCSIAKAVRLALAYTILTASLLRKDVHRKQLLLLLRLLQIMQKERTRDYPSKPLGLYAAMEWGLGNIKFLSPFSFCGTKGESELTFHVSIQDYDKGFNLLLPKFNEQFLILFIPNKSGDNTILLSKEDCEMKMGSLVSMEWLSKYIKRKWNMTLSRTSTTI